MSESSSSPSPIPIDPVYLSVSDQIESLPLSDLKNLLLEASLNSPILEAKIREAVVVQQKKVKSESVISDTLVELEERLELASTSCPATIEEILAIFKQFQEDIIIQFQHRIELRNRGRECMRAFSVIAVELGLIEEERDSDLGRSSLLECLESFVAMSWGKWESEKFTVATFIPEGFTQTEWDSVWYQYRCIGYELISNDQIISPPCPYPHPFTAKSPALLLSCPPEIIGHIFSLASEPPYIPIIVDVYVLHSYHLSRTMLLKSLALTHSTWRTLAQLELISFPEITTMESIDRLVKFVKKRRLFNMIHRIIIRQDQRSASTALATSITRLATLAPNIQYIELSGQFHTSAVAALNLFSKASFLFIQFSISSQDYTRSPVDITAFKLDLPLTRSLTFYNSFQISLVSTASISRLILGSSEDIEAFSTTKQCFPNVNSLELISTYDDENEDDDYEFELLSIADYLPNLTLVTLNLVQTLYSRYYSSIINILEDLISKNKLLETIKIEFFPHVDPTSRIAQHNDLSEIVEMQNAVRAELQNFVTGTAIGKIKLLW